MRTYLFSFLVSIATLASAKDGAFLQSYTTNQISIVAGFVPDASRIIVGEPIFLTFVVSNRTDQPFQFSFFGDSNFRIAATNAAGIPIRNRHPGWGGDGGGSSVSVLRGKAYNERVLLDNWCGFDRPGEYTVTCRYLFPNYPNGNTFLAPSIVTVFKLTVLPTDPNRITEIIKTWGHVVETNGSLHEAAQALAEINDPRTIPFLAVLVMKDSDINYIAADALARFTNNLAAADALTSALKNGGEFNIYVPQIASTALRNFHQTDRAARTLLPGLTNSDANVRIQTARAVSWTGSGLAFAPLCALLKDETNTVRYAAAEAIGRLGDARSFAVLTNCLTSSDFALRIDAVNGLRVLGRTVEPAWVKPMILSGGENIRTYYDAIDLLRMYGGDKAAPGLASCLHFDDPSVRHPYNFRLMLALEFCPNGPKYFYKWTCDQNRDGTEEEIAENRQILSEVKAWLEKHKLNSE
jgi:hypothetical protein